MNPETDKKEQYPDDDFSCSVCGSEKRDLHRHNIDGKNVLMCTQCFFDSVPKAPPSNGSVSSEYRRANSKKALEGKKNGQADNKPKGGWGTPGWRPKVNLLPANEKTIRARMKIMEEERIREENWGGPCKGGCGKYINGQYVCDACVKAKQEKAFALQPGETEIYRARIGKPEDKVVKQIVVTEADSVELDNVTWV